MLQTAVWALSNTEAATGGALLKISQHSQENTCARASFLIKLYVFSEHLRTTASKVSIKFGS